MTTPNSTQPASEYVRVLRPLLPVEAFRPNSRHLIRIAVHTGIIAAGYYVLCASSPTYFWILVSLLIGHSLACILFLAHDVSHNSVVRNRSFRCFLELLLWGANLIPPTLWHRVHNHSHHLETNTVNDPDRLYRAIEGTAFNRLYMRLCFANRKTPGHHPFVLFSFVPYIFRNLITSLLPGTLKPSIVTFKPKYTARQKTAILFEVVVIAAAQIGMWYLMDRSLLRYFCAVPLPLLIASSVAMTYIFTNHFLNPLCEQTDPLVGSTSVIVPRWMDWLHDNFSYHTEHHVFPGMNPRYYPQVSCLLQSHFPERYNRLPLKEAWRRLWLQDEFIKE